MKKEPKTIAGHILEAIGIRQLFQKKEKPTDPIDIAVAVVNRIKDLVNTGTATWLATLIDAVLPGDQKELISTVRKAIAYALLQLELASHKNRKIPVTTAQNEQLNEALLTLRSINKKERGPLYSQLAGYIYSELSNEDYESAKQKTDEKYQSVA